MKSCELFVAKSSDYYINAPSVRGRETFLYPLQTGHFLYEPGYRQQRASYDSFLLMYIQDGSLCVDLPNGQQSVHKNQFVLIDCYQPHGYHSDNGWEALWLHFDGVVARGYYEQIIERLGNVFSLADPASCLNKLHLIYQAFYTGRTVKEALMNKYITDILTDFLLLVPACQKQTDYATAISSVTSFVSAHFQEPLTIGQLAALASLSPYHFIRIFRQETGFTPHEYLIQTRMHAARFLLVSTELTVKEICFETGFSCESTFCTAFKKINGVTPNEYRNTVSCT